MKALRLPFPDHVRDFDSTRNDMHAVKLLESGHRSGVTFDGPMVLLRHVVQIPELPNLESLFLKRMPVRRCFLPGSASTP